MKFYEKFIVDANTGCWNWTHSLNTGGYGRVYISGKHILAHRFSYEMFNGDFDKSMFVCHKCDNPICVNPDHLFIGTAKDNNHDMMAKGRHRTNNVGRKHSEETKRKISEAQRGKPRPKSRRLLPKHVKYIREQYDDGKINYSALSRQLGISDVAIKKIAKRITYKPR